MTRLTYAQCYASFLTAVREGNVHHAVTALTYAGGRWPGKTEDWPRFAVVDIWRERQAECIARMALMTWTWGRRISETSRRSLDSEPSRCIVTYMELTNTPATFQPGDKVRILATGAIAHVIDTVPSPAPRFLVYIAPCSVWKDATEIEVAA